MILLCVSVMAVVLWSALIPYDFTPPQYFVSTFGLGALLAAVGVWLNHLAEKSTKKG
jgi:hypothetical protein